MGGGCGCWTRPPTISYPYASNMPCARCLPPPGRQAHCPGRHGPSLSCGLDEPLFFEPTKDYVTLRWVVLWLVQCPVRYNGKGDWRKDTNTLGGGGGGWVWVPLAGS